LTQVNPGSSSRELNFLYRVRSTYSPTSCSQAQSTFLGFFLLRGIKTRNPLTGCNSNATYGPSSAFLTLSMAYASLLLEGLFHPPTTSEIYSSRAFPGSQSLLLITEVYPHVVYDKPLRFSHRQLLRDASTVPVRAARLQGFAPTSRSVAADRVFTSVGTRSPLEFSHFQAFTEHLGDAFTPPPLMTFPAKSSL
jgi:hypothetical protein